MPSVWQLMRLIVMNKWISVEDRLPITKQEMVDNNHNYMTVEVICFGKIGDHTVYIDDFEAGNTINFWCKFASTNPTHWMPLPEPPK